MYEDTLPYHAAGLRAEFGPRQDRTDPPGCRRNRGKVSAIPQRGHHPRGQPPRRCTEDMQGDNATASSRDVNMPVHWIRAGEELQGPPDEVERGGVGRTGPSLEGAPNTNLAGFGCWQIARSNGPLALLGAAWQNVVHDVFRPHLGGPMIVNLRLLFWTQIRSDDKGDKGEYMRRKTRQRAATTRIKAPAPSWRAA